MIDWSAVQDGLGRGHEVPALIAALASSKKAERNAAFVSLSDERLVHQGTVWPAAPVAVPLLAEALRAPKHPGRHLVIALLGTIAVGAPIAYLQGALGRDALRALETGAGIEGDAYRAVRGLANDVAARLAEKSGEVRASTAMTLALVDPAEAAARLPERLGAEKDEAVRLALWIALGLAATLGGARMEVPATVSGASDVERAGRAVAAALAGVEIDPAELDASFREPIASSEIPFGKLFDAALGAALMLGDPGRGVLARALEAAPPLERSMLASALVTSAFPRAHQGRTDVALVSSSTLAPAALETIRMVARVATEASWPPLAWLPSVGVTRWLPDLKRYVGLEPAGPLERRVAWREAEVETIVVLDAVARNDASEPEGRAALTEAATTEQRADLALAAAGDAYLTLHSRPGWTVERAVSFASSLLAPGSRPYLEARVRDNRVVGYAIYVVFGAFAAEPEPALATDLDLVSLFGRAVPMMRGPELVDLFRGALAVLPVATRAAVVGAAALPESVERSPRIRALPVPPAFAGWSYLDLAVDRAAAALQAATCVARWTALPDGRQMRPVEAAVRVLAALRPESRAAIEAVLPTATEYGRSTLEPLLRPN